MIHLQSLCQIWSFFLGTFIHGEVSSKNIYDLANQLYPLTIKMIKKCSFNNELVVKEQKKEIKTAEKILSVEQGNAEISTIIIDYIIYLL